MCVCVLVCVCVGGGGMWCVCFLFCPTISFRVGTGFQYYFQTFVGKGNNSDNDSKVFQQQVVVSWCFTPSQPVRLYQGDQHQVNGKHHSQCSMTSQPHTVSFFHNVFLICFNVSHS